MSLATQLRKEGLEEGIRQGLEQGYENGQIVIAQRMIAEGSDLAFIGKVSGLSWAQIKELQKNKF